MKILHVNKGYYPWIGGIETAVKQYAEYSCGKGHDVTVLCCSKEFSLKTTTKYVEGVKVITSSSLGTYFSMPISISFLYYFIANSNKFDLVHLHLPFPLSTVLCYFFSFKKVKLVVSWHCDIYKQKLFKKIVIPFQNKICAKADLILVGADRTQKFSYGLSKYKVKTKLLPYSIRISDYSQDDSDLEIVSGKYMIFLGRFTEYKGLAVLLKAMKTERLNDVSFVIAGRGDLSTEDRNYIASRKNVTLIERYVTNAERNGLLARAHGFLFPSITPNESFGIVQLEAMIYGVPVINTWLETGVPDVSLHNVSGYTIKPNSAEELIDAILKLWTLNDSEYSNFSTNAKNRVTNSFSELKTLPLLEEYYESII